MSAYPGQPIQRGESKAAIVTQIQTALANKGYACPNPGVFDAAMVSCVKLFQAQQVDAAGNPLVVDGVVGRFTWMALFGQDRMDGKPASLMASMALHEAATQIGVMEDRGRPNRGPMVDVYLETVGLDPDAGGPQGYPWCQAFVYWCFVQASRKLNVANPVPQTAGVLAHWNKAASNPKATRYLAAAVMADLSLASPGALVVYDFGQGAGHIAFIEQCQADGTMVTVEGNTNDVGGREGLGVLRLTRRKIAASAVGLKGLIVYSD